MSEELLECPFCSGKAGLQKDNHYGNSLIVCCEGCGIQTPACSGHRSYVIKTWNTRAVVKTKKSAIVEEENCDKQ